MNTTHTPGPWAACAATEGLHAVRAPTSWNPLGMVICDVGYGLTVENNEANARLIAAAPDLLAALVELTNMCGRQADFNDDGDGRMFDRCFAAITKAVGPA